MNAQRNLRFAAVPGKQLGDRYESSPPAPAV
jgi:hypothetical protein